jgi:hypothetical protein
VDPISGILNFEFLNANEREIHCKEEKGALFTKQRLHQKLSKMASRQGPSKKVEEPWRRAFFYRVSLS